MIRRAAQDNRNMETVNQKQDECGKSDKDKWWEWRRSKWRVWGSRGPRWRAPRKLKIIIWTRKKIVKWIMIDPIGGIKMTLIPMVALDNTSNRLWLAALPILPELRFWFIGTIKQLEEEFEQRELYSHDLEFSSICIQVVPGFLSWVFLVAVFTSIFGRMCGHLFWIHGRGETFYANLKPMMDGRENQWADKWPFLGRYKEVVKPFMPNTKWLELKIKDYLFWVHGNITARWNCQQEQRHKSTFGRFIHFDIFRKLWFLWSVTPDHQQHPLPSPAAVRKERRTRKLPILSARKPARGGVKMKST